MAAQSRQSGRDTLEAPGARGEPGEAPGAAPEGRVAAAWRALRAMWADARLKGLSAYPSMAQLRDWDSAGAAPCQHMRYEKHCVVYAFKGLLRGLAVGYGLRAAFSLATTAFSARMLRSPLRVLSAALLSRRAARFAIFLGAMGFVYRNLQCLLCKVLGRPSKRGSAAAAFVAASTVLLETREQRSTLAGFLFVRASFEAVRTLVHYKYLAPREYALPFVFGLCQVPIMFSFLRQPSALNRGYYSWIKRMGNMTNEQLHRITGMTKLAHEPCGPVYHTGSCITYNLKDWVRAVVFRTSLVYIPVHLVPPLLFKRKHVMRAPGTFLAESSVAIFRSSLFLGTYVAIVKSNVCFFRWLLGRTSSNAVRWAGLATGFSLLFEHPRRHAELVQYVIPRAFETLFNLHSASLPAWFNWLRDSGYGDLFLLCSACAMFVVCADTQPKLKGLNATIFRLLFGSGTAMIRPGAPGSPRGPSAARRSLTTPAGLRIPLGGTGDVREGDEGEDDEGEGAAAAAPVHVAERVETIERAVAAEAAAATTATTTGGGTLPR